MMQIFLNLLRVIFMLSTIVAVTDCCSSRILLLKEHTMKVVEEHKLYNQEHAADALQEDLMSADVDFQKNFTAESYLTSYSINPDDKESTTTTTAPVTNTEFTDSTPLEEAIQSVSVKYETDMELLVTSTALPKETNSDLDVLKSKEFHFNEPSMRDPRTGNGKFPKDDNYYKIMRDILSLECTGDYLTDFCLNGGRCFRYPLGHHNFFSCECADDYVGERCESKTLKNGLLAPTPALDAKPRILMARTLFSYPILIAITLIHIICGAMIIFICPYRQQRASASLKVIYKD